MRLYRGLQETYKPDRVLAGMHGTDFTDCPFSALAYARGVRGQVLVVEASNDLRHRKFTEEYWGPGARSKRIMVWGKFDEYIIGILPAKELRKLVRVKGMSAYGEEYKSAILKEAIARALAQSVQSPLQSNEVSSSL